MKLRHRRHTTQRRLTPGERDRQFYGSMAWPRRQRGWLLAARR